MKKRMCTALILLLVFCLCFGGSALAEETEPGLDHITDAAGLLSPEQMQKLESLAAQYSEQGQVELYVVTMEDSSEYPGTDVEDCAGQLYEYFSLGSKTDRSGVLLLLSAKDKNYAIIVRGEYGCYCFGQENLALAKEAFVNGCGGGSWAGGFEDFLNQCGDILLTARAYGLSLDQTNLSYPGQSFPYLVYRYGVTAEGGQSEPQPSQTPAEEPAAQPTEIPAETPAQESQTGSGQLEYVTDQAGILTDSQRQKLNERAAAISEQHHCSLYIVTVNDHTQFNPDVYEAAKGIFTYYDLGYGDGRDGVILLLSMNERDYAFTGHGDLGETICGYESSWIIEDEFLDNFRKNDWYGGFSDYLEACGKQLTKLEKGEDITQGADIISGPDGLDYHEYNAPGRSEMPVALKLVIAIGAPSLIALIVCSTFKAQMKTAKERTTAEDYVVPGSATLRIREDRFTHRTESRTRINTDSGSSRGGGGGGSSFHSGGGFSGRSGKF